MNRRMHGTEVYEVTVQNRDSKIVFDRFGLWDAQMEADRQRKLNPVATVTVRKVQDGRRPSRRAGP